MTPPDCRSRAGRFRATRFRRYKRAMESGDYKAAADAMNDLIRAGPPVIGGWSAQYIRDLRKLARSCVVYGHREWMRPYHNMTKRRW